MALYWIYQNFLSLLDSARIGTREQDQIKLEDFADKQGDYKFGLGALVELCQYNFKIAYFRNYIIN